MQTITTHFARRVGGSGRCFLPELVNSEAALQVLADTGLSRALRQGVSR